MPFLTFCSDDDNNGENDSGEVEALKGTIASDVALKAGITYKLSDKYIVGIDAALNIEVGVKIISTYGDTVDYILIEQGTKINAMGAADASIVMTSEREEPGVWNGIHIYGKARTNAERGKGGSGIGGAVYGGNDNADNPSKLRHVRVECTGYTLDEEHEVNGIVLYGVGSGTVVDHCQTYRGSGGGFGFFGGPVDVNNTMVVSCNDDSFGWTKGWNGRGANLVAYQEPKAALGYDRGCLIEVDDNENDNAASPISHPTLGSLTPVGGGENKQGIHLRRGTQVHIDDIKVCDRDQPLTIESALTGGALKNGIFLLVGMTIPARLATNGDYTNADFIATTGNKVDAISSYASSDAIKAECDRMNGNRVK